MDKYQLYLLLAGASQLIFVTAFGACVGSLINVLVYRLPLGLGVVTPPSRCPSCSTRLTWRENIPIFGWLLLRGRCRFCKAPISPEYPIVEAFVAVMFGLLFALWYVVPEPAVWLGVDWGAIKPEWARGGLGLTWPTFVTTVILLASLVAMTLIDARTFTIPLVLTWVPTLLALVAHPLHALWIQETRDGLRHAAIGEVWTIPTPGPNGWPWIGGSIGAVLGLVIANVLLRLGIFKRSFADYEEWEKGVLAQQAPSTAATSTASRAPSLPAPEAIGAETNASTPDGALLGRDPAEPVAPAPPAPARQPTGAKIIALTTIIMAVVGGVVGVLVGFPPAIGGLVGLAIGPLAGAPIARARLDDPGRKSEEAPAHMWIQYPHSRREMVREVIFLSPCIGLGLLGGALAIRLAGPWTYNPGLDAHVASVHAPLWLVALGGVLTGYLVGGGVVWGVRILGSLLFGKEAMGLGDVHMMAAVGACLGWIDPTLAFFGACFVGIYLWLFGMLRWAKAARAMPFGPSLAVATGLVLVLKPLIELGLGALLRRTVDLP